MEKTNIKLQNIEDIHKVVEKRRKEETIMWYIQYVIEIIGRMTLGMLVLFLANKMYDITQPTTDPIGIVSLIIVLWIIVPVLEPVIQLITRRLSGNTN